MNNMNLLGRIAKTPETRTAGNTAITTLIVATDRLKLNNEGTSYKDPQTGCTAQGAEFHKANLYNGWQDQGGVERFGCEVIGEKVHFC